MRTKRGWQALKRERRRRRPDRDSHVGQDVRNSLVGFLAAAWVLSRTYAFMLYSFALATAVALCRLEPAGEESLGDKSLSRFVGLAPQCSWFRRDFLCLRHNFALDLCSQAPKVGQSGRKRSLQSILPGHLSWIVKIGTMSLASCHSVKRCLTATPPISVQRMQRGTKTAWFARIPALLTGERHLGLRDQSGIHRICPEILLITYMFPARAVV